MHTTLETFNNEAVTHSQTSQSYYEQNAQQMSRCVKTVLLSGLSSYLARFDIRNGTGLPRRLEACTD